MARIGQWSDKISIRGIVTSITFLLALPVNLGIITGFALWFSPFIMLNSVLAVRTIVPLNIIGIIVLIIFFFRKRFYCRYICPTGFCLDNLKFKNKADTSFMRHFPDIGGWLALFSVAGAAAGLPILILVDPAAIFTSFFSSFAGKPVLVTVLSLSFLPILLIFNILLPGLWCSKICPLGGFQDILYKVRELYNLRRGHTDSRPAKIEYSPARRYFIATGTGILAGLIIPSLVRGKAGRRIRPPASVENSKFNTLCIRCGNCIKACPANILKHSSDTSEILSWMTPEVSFTEGYCLESCNRCGQVCPSGSIQHFSLASKSDLFMATAIIEYGNCLLLQNRECDRCKAACPYSAVKMIPSEEFSSVLPAINTSKCVGCGACAVICPTGTIKMQAPVLD